MEFTIILFVLLIQSLVYGFKHTIHNVHKPKNSYKRNIFMHHDENDYSDYIVSNNVETHINLPSISSIDEIKSDMIEILHPSIGDYNDQDEKNYLDQLSENERLEYNKNVGLALEVLRRQLPYVFATSSLDFSIFAQQITLQDEKRNRFVMQKSLYSAAVRSLRMASIVSSISPMMNVKKIDYIEDVQTIQCLVDVVLPDNVLIDGQSVWEGMFYFGLNTKGLIESHTFDRKISTLNPGQLRTNEYPWINSQSKNTVWNEELIAAGPVFTSDINDEYYLQ